MHLYLIKLWIFTLWSICILNQTVENGTYADTSGSNPGTSLSTIRIERMLENMEDKVEKLTKRFGKFERDFNGFRTQHIFPLEQQVNVLNSDFAKNKAFNQKNFENVLKEIKEIRSDVNGFRPQPIFQLEQQVKVLNRDYTENKAFNQKNFENVLKETEEIRSDVNKFLGVTKQVQEKLENFENQSRFILENATKIQNLSDKVQETFSRILPHTISIYGLSRNYQIISGNVQENSKNIEKNYLEINKAAEQIIDISKKVQKNGEEVDEHSAKIDSNSIKINDNADNLKKETKNINSISEEVKNISYKVNINSIRIQDAFEQIENVNNKTHVMVQDFDKFWIGTDSKLSSLGTLVFTWKVENISEKFHPTSPKVESEWFTLTGYLLKAKAKLSLRNDSIYASVTFKDARSTLSSFYPFPQLTYVLKDRNGSEARNDRLTSPPLLFNSAELKYNEDVLEGFLIDRTHLLSSRFAKDDSIVLEIHVESPSMTRMSYSSDGVVVGKVDHVDERVWWATSPYFYTHPNGYRVQVRFNVSDHIQPLVPFLTTNHDTALPTAFPHVTTLTVFNTNDYARNLIRYKQADISEGAMYAIPHVAYDEVKHMVVNNTLYYEIKINKL